MRDYEKIYVSVVDFTVSSLVLLLAMILGWFTQHIGVKAAFLDEDVNFLLYIMFPFNVPNKNKRKLYSLQNSLCRPEQALLLWFTKLRSFNVDDMKYMQIKTDCSILIKRESNGVIAIFLGYVHDLIFDSTSIGQLKREVARFLARFEETEETLERYLCVHICPSKENWLSLSPHRLVAFSVIFS